MKKEQENWEEEFDELWEGHTSFAGYDNEGIKVFIHQLCKKVSKSEKEKLLKEFIEGKRCLNCGELKENWQGDLSSWCGECLEAE